VSQIVQPPEGVVKHRCRKPPGRGQIKAPSTTAFKPQSASCPAPLVARDVDNLVAAKTAGRVRGRSGNRSDRQSGQRRRLMLFVRRCHRKCEVRPDVCSGHYVVGGGGRERYVAAAGHRRGGAPLPRVGDLERIGTHPVQRRLKLQHATDNRSPGHLGDDRDSILCTTRSRLGEMSKLRRDRSLHLTAPVQELLDLAASLVPGGCDVSA
jgi:hypothetical protein